MNWLLKILRDPNPEDKTGATPTINNDRIGLAPDPEPDPIPDPVPAKPEVPNNDKNIPKTKEDWDRLQESDPKAWIRLTQPRMDQAIREAREAREKLTQIDSQYKNLKTELDTIKGSKKEEIPSGDGQKVFSRENLPATDAEWEQLWIEKPNLAADLRHHKNEQDRIQTERMTNQQQEFIKTRKESAQLIWDRHPEMYVLEKDENGIVKTDGNGKPILKRDLNTGAPILDFESEKGKLFVEVYSEDPQGYDGSKFGPKLAMAEMERRLRDKGMEQIKSNNGQQGQSQASAVDQRGVMPSGVTPPVSIQATFASDAEKARAQLSVERGVYKSLEEYCQFRDGKHEGFVEESRTPKFK